MWRSLLIPLVLLAAWVRPAQACDVAVINHSDFFLGNLRLYDQNNRYLGRGASAPIGRGERYFFAEDTMTNRQGTWPQGCEGLVYLEMDIAADANAVINPPGLRRVCHIGKRITHAPEPTLSTNMHDLIVITSTDINHPGNCRDR